MMISKKLLWLFATAAVITGSVFLSSCDKEFDEPPIFEEPNITANMTIKQLKALHTVSGQFDTVKTESVISGIVVGDDKTGNFYKSLVIQDETGGIAIRMNQGSLYTSYPRGRRIYVKVKGLVLNDYNRLQQIGAGVDNSDPTSPQLASIEPNMFDSFIVKGSFNNTVIPKVVSATAALTTTLQDTLQNTLIQLNNFEFAVADTNKTYAPYQINQNYTIRNCSGSSIVLRNSGYATFQPVPVPNGNGTIVGVYSVFGSTKQLMIRDTSDVQFNGARCNSGGGGGGNVVSIAALRAMYNSSSDVTLPAMQIKGTVISDAASKNMGAGNVVVQDGTAGITLFYGSAAPTTNLNVGDSVEFDISGGTLTDYNGLVEVVLSSSQFPGAKIATGRTVVPKKLTIAQVNAQVATLQSQLVEIENITSSPTGTYSGSKNLSDATGTIVMYTASGATFATTALPAAVSKVVAYVSQFNTTNQIQIRNTNDVTGGGTPPVGGGITLGTSPVMINFDDIASGLPAGVFVKQESTATSIGNDASVYSGWAKTAWNQSSLGAKNYASATGLTSASDAAAQDASTNRALGFRQTSTPNTGGDPGVAFVLQLANTTGKSNIKLEFLLQSLDVTSTVTRVTTWNVEYGVGDSPSSFTTMTTAPATLTTNNTFASTPVTVDFGSALNNISGKVWIRIVAKTGTTGSGSRPSSAVDDVKFTFN